MPRAAAASSSRLAERPARWPAMAWGGRVISRVITLAVGEDALMGRLSEGYAIGDRSGCQRGRAMSETAQPAEVYGGPRLAGRPLQTQAYALGRDGDGASRALVSAATIRAPSATRVVGIIAVLLCVREVCGGPLRRWWCRSVPSTPRNMIHSAGSDNQVNPHRIYAISDEVSGLIAR